MSLNVCVENIFYNLLLLMQVLCVLTSSAVKFNEYVIDQGKNLTLTCDNNSPVMWVREGKKEDGYQEIQPDGSIILTNITPNDEGLYTCSKILSNSDIDSNNQTYSSSKLDDNFNLNISTIVTSDTESVVEIMKANVIVRTTPGPVSKFTVRTTTIIGVIVWEVFPNRTATGGYAIRDFTTEMRRQPYNETDQPIWERLDPHHISPNARMLEIYHLLPNTTYQFRIWANNQLGAGEPVTISGLTSPDVLEKDLLRRIMVDAENFDTRVWIVAVGVVLGTLAILSLGTCIVLYKECHEPTEIEEELDSLELVPNIILNPGFCDSDDGDRPSTPILTSFLPYQQQPRPQQQSDDDDDDDDDLDEEDHMSFSRKMSIFFTGNTIKRI